MIKTAPKKDRTVEESRELRKIQNFKVEGKNLITFEVKQLKGSKYKDETVCVNTPV